MVTDPTARIVENLFTVQRIGTSINAESQALLDELFEQIIDDLRRIAPDEPSAERWKRYRTDQFIAAVEERLAKVWPQWETLLHQHLVTTARVQSRFAQQLLVATLGEAGDRARLTPITATRAKAILETNPFGDTVRGKALLSEWSEGLSRTTRDRITRQIRLGMLQEESIPDLVRRIRGEQQGYIRQDPATGQFVAQGTKGAVVRRRFTGGVWEATTRDTEALVRTAVNFMSNAGAEDTYERNATILKGLEFSATLDDRTTLLCASYDGQVFDLDDPERPQLPLHWGCRSTYVPLPDWEKLGLPEPLEGDRAARDFTGVTEEELARKVSARRRRQGLGSQTRVPSSVRYEEWLRDQPARVQDKVLGKGKADLFRSGRIGLKDLVRQDHTIVPLAELLS